MAIKALYKDKIIRPLEPLKGVREGLIEIEIKPSSEKSSIVARTRGTVKLPLKIAREIAEREEFFCGGCSTVECVWSMQE